MAATPSDPTGPPELPRPDSPPEPTPAPAPPAGPPPAADPLAPPAKPSHVPGQTPTGGRGPFGEQQLPPPGAGAPTAPGTIPGQPAPGGSRGCGTPLMIGCGVITVLVGIAAVVFILNAGRFLGWMYDLMGQEALKNLPEAVSVEDRDRLRDAFAAVAEGAREGTLDGQRVMAAQTDLSTLLETPKEEVTGAQVRELAASLERAAGVQRQRPEEDPPGQGTEPGEIRGPPGS